MDKKTSDVSQDIIQLVLPFYLKNKQKLQHFPL